MPKLTPEALGAIQNFMYSGPPEVFMPRSQPETLSIFSAAEVNVSREARCDGDSGGRSEEESSHLSDVRD